MYCHLINDLICPKSLLEAAASGRPVVTTNIPGCRDAIIENSTGTLVPLYDVDLLTSKTKKLLNNPQVIHDMGLKGRLLAEKNLILNMYDKPIL